MITKHVFTRDHVSLSLRGLTKAVIGQNIMRNGWSLELYHGSTSTPFCYETDETGCRAAFDAVTAYMQEETL